MLHLGLVGITPAAGYVGTPSSLAIGVLTAVACNFATKLKFLLKIDETLDVWALHGIGGFTGSIRESSVASEANFGSLMSYFQSLVSLPTLALPASTA